ncbi:MAG: fumarate hydratase [Spirochaetes bacterium]|nr:fumarate hydratase [Spirochaetota bacterium]
MREVSVKEIIPVVRDLCMNANFDLGKDVLDAFDRGIKNDESPVAKEVLKELKENAEISRNERRPLCQDCGLAVLFVEMGQDVHITGGDLREALNEGMKQGYKDGYLRKSACHPFSRKNTGDNSPAIIHFNIVPGEKIKIIMAPKGGGSENMSMVKMMTPSDGIEGIKKTVIARLEEASANPCPPTVVGIGIGGTFERSAYLAKKALLREIGKRNPDPELAKIEVEILEGINKLGIGPMGYGGTTTCLDVFMELEPCHIASFPLAINVNCHSARHKEAVI